MQCSYYTVSEFGNENHGRWDGIGLVDKLNPLKGMLLEDLSWALLDLNQRPVDYESTALTN
jgi:hypothetical protein